MINTSALLRLISEKSTYKNKCSCHGNRLMGRALGPGAVNPRAFIIVTFVVHSMGRVGTGTGVSMRIVSVDEISQVYRFELT